MLQEVFENIDEGKTWTLGPHVVQAKNHLISSLIEIADILPLTIIDTLLQITKILPESVSPLASSVVGQILVATIYSSVSGTGNNGTINLLTNMLNRYNSQYQTERNHERKS